MKCPLAGFYASSGGGSRVNRRCRENPHPTPHDTTKRHWASVEEIGRPGSCPTILGLVYDDALLYPQGRFSPLVDIEDFTPLCFLPCMNPRTRIIEAHRVL